MKNRIFRNFKRALKKKDLTKWDIDAKTFQKKIGHRFSNIELLKNAVRHTSYTTGRHSNLSSFERMEFLGDSILGFLVSESLYKKYPKKSEGELSKLKAKVVSKKYLSKIANSIDLGSILLLSNDEKKSGGKKRPSILADSMEAVICGIYFDSGIKDAKSFVLKTVLKNFESEVKLSYLKNYKGIIQEYSQERFHVHPVYEIVGEQGADHKKVFVVRVTINDQTTAKGSGNSKKQAEQSAARNLWEKIR